MESNSPQAKSSDNATQNSSQNHKHHPIALELVRLVNVVGFNPERKTVTSKNLKFQGIVKKLNDKKVFQTRRIEMTGIKLSFDSKLQEMYVGLGCTLKAQNHCTFNGKIYLKKARVRDVADEVNITRKFEAVQNVDRNAVRYYHHVS